MFLEIFATFFGIKSLNNLLFNKFKCKMARAASYQLSGVEECRGGSAAPIIANIISTSFFLIVKLRIVPVSKKVTRIMHM